jgi:hypothetical protein
VEEIRSEEEERRRTGESPSRTELAQQATPQRRERGDQPERERDEDRGLVDRAKDAVMGSEEESRRREGNERSDRSRVGDARWKPPIRPFSLVVFTLSLAAGAIQKTLQTECDESLQVRASTDAKTDQR